MRYQRRSQQRQIWAVCTRLFPEREKPCGVSKKIEMEVNSISIFVHNIITPFGVIMVV